MWVKGRHWLLVATLWLTILVSGCPDFDKRGFERAKTQNTEESYLGYINKYPNGRFVADAKQLVDLRAFEKAKAQNTIDAYQSYLAKHKSHQQEAKAAITKIRIDQYQHIKNEAIIAEKSGNWPGALETWNKAKKHLSLDKAEVGEQIKACQQEANKRASICEQIIENPIEISDKEVTGSYYFKSESAGSHYTSVRVTGKATNKCPFPVYDIVLCFNLYAKHLAINNKTWEDIGRSSTLLDSVKHTICGDKGLQPGETRSFSFRAPISGDIDLLSNQGDEFMIHGPEPEYSLEVKSYKAGS